MDSRLIAGAYSQHFRALEQEGILNDSSMIDSLVRAKRLSQETNKRRKVQAQKRKIEAKKEERRRQDILNKRREEQNQATEKYQRSHLPPSTRQGSGRFSPRRHTASALEDALRLIRGGPRSERIRSARESTYSHKNENENPLDRSYFDKPGHYLRPGSARAAYQMDASARAELMDVSMQNLTSSKTLFEQQLEQQQNLLLEQQQQALREFNNAVHQEIDSNCTAGRVSHYNSDERSVGTTGEAMTHSDSCSSLDSLEDGKKESEKARDQGYEGGVGQQVHNQPDSSQGQTSQENSQQQPQTVLQGQMKQPEQLNVRVNQRNDHRPLNQDMTASALYQNTATIIGMPRSDIENLPGTPDNTVKSQYSHSYVGLTREDILGKQNQITNGNTKVGLANTHQHLEQKYQLPVKQFSTDSLESCSSVITVPTAKTVGVTPDAGSLRQESSSGPHPDVGSQNQNVLMGTSGKQYSNSNHSGQPTVTDAGTSANKEQTAWVSPPPQSDTATPALSHKNEPVVDNFHPRYVSAIGSSIWPGQSAHNQLPTSAVSTLIANNTHPYSSRGTLTNVTTTTSYPASVPAKSVPNTTSYSTAGAKSDTVLKPSSAVNGPPSKQLTAFPHSNSFNNDFPSLNNQDFTYPHIQDYQHTGAAQSILNQKHGQPSQTNQPYGQHQQISNLNIHGISVNTNNAAVTNQQTPMAAQLAPQHPPNGSHMTTLPQPSSTGTTVPQTQQPLFHVVTGPVPVPAVRTVFPTSRPPAPVPNFKADQSTPSAGQTKSQGCNATHQNGGIWTNNVRNTSNVSAKDKNAGVDKVDENEEDVDSEEMPPLKGILKQAPSKTTPQIQGKPGQGKSHPRDSLELARLQSDKKAKKKSVRFADHHIEENENEADDEESFGTGGIVITATGTPVYRSTLNRPGSAKVVSMTQKPDLSLRGQRSTSAGSTRSQQYSNIPYEAMNGNLNHRSNLPSSFVNPLNTSTPINRPKAAAHIIMSTEAHQDNRIVNGQDSHVTSASTVHKSHLESKVKNTSNNFMSKVPVKIPVQGDTNAVIYHAARVENDSYVNTILNTNGNNAADDGHHERSMDGQHHQGHERSKVSYSGTKRVPYSSPTVTRTTIVPASTKITHPQANNGTPSYSTGAGTTSGNVVYDENGMRIDRTPTDEEITWLWDKVRNCLSKEDNGNRNQPGGNGNTEQGTRQPPALSTKLIDGASLGIGTNINNNNGGINGLRTGSGFFYPRTSPAATTTTQNKVKPALQQPGSYLRRFGLLKQRRATSATPVGNPSQSSAPRVSSAVYGRHGGHQPSQATPTSAQPQQQDVPTPLALAYKPQDEVSESTAAFVMAERLAKQSLSDSHIQMAMEDAQIKQEAHNRLKMTVSKAGPSALSLEEQRLLESLDKLNDRLKVADSKHSGTIHYHQPYQAHPSGFRGHTPVIDIRRNMLTTPRTQQRSQSARIRQQTRQYR